jgi:hypothetical protein
MLLQRLLRFLYLSGGRRLSTHPSGFIEVKPLDHLFAFG